MNKKFFGTDGIRGTVNESYLTADTALKLGIAAGKVFTRGPHIHRVVIGKDTRVSGYMLETALTSGFTSVSNYDYEVVENDKKREINIIEPGKIDGIVRRFEEIMSA